MNPTDRIVVALGGNAIEPPGVKADIRQQFDRTREACKFLVDAVQAGHQLVLTHGNGPQVGDILRRVELASEEVYPIDLGLCVADSQAIMGYMICQCLANEMVKRGMPDDTCAVVTSVLVDKDDAAFKLPTKPIGAVYTREEAECHQREDGWIMREIPKLGYRRIVPSPKPREILELPQIKRLVDDNQIIVCSGGGGIPVVHNEEWGYEGVEAVIDKDLSAALLALGLNADMLAIITGVDQVFLDFGQPNQKPIDRMTLTEAQGHLAAGQFPAGSMGPKIEACIHFLRDTKTADARVLITSIEAFNDALAGRTGTWITQT